MEPGTLRHQKKMAKMAALKLTRGNNLTRSQCLMLLHGMEQNPELASRRSETNLTRQCMNALWDQLWKLVSSQPGPAINSEDLKRRWARWKNRVKTKAAGLRARKKGITPLSDVEMRVLKLIEEPETVEETKSVLSEVCKVSTSNNSSNLSVMETTNSEFPNMGSSEDLVDSIRQRYSLVQQSDEPPSLPVDCILHTVNHSYMQEPVTCYPQVPNCELPMLQSMDDISNSNSIVNGNLKSVPIQSVKEIKQEVEHNDYNSETPSSSRPLNQEDIRTVETPSSSRPYTEDGIPAMEIPSSSRPISHDDVHISSSSRPIWKRKRKLRATPLPLVLNAFLEGQREHINVMRTLEDSVRQGQNCIVSAMHEQTNAVREQTAAIQQQTAVWQQLMNLLGSNIMSSKSSDPDVSIH